MVYYLLAGAGGWGGELQKQCLLGTTLSLLFQVQISCGYLHKPEQWFACHLFTMQRGGAHEASPLSERQSWMLGTGVIFLSTVAIDKLFV